MKQKRKDLSKAFSMMDQKRSQKEKQDKQRSAAITAAITALLLFSFMFWVGFAGTIPPPGEPQWKTVGRIDFGTDALGKLDVNNFQDPSPKPRDKPKTNPKPKKTETQPKPTVSDPAPKNNKSETQSEQTVVENNDPAPNPSETNTTPKPKADNNSSTTTNSDPNKSDSRPQDSDDGGGSNHGDTDKDGNRGNPKSKILDKNGMFEFGDGIGGPGGRGPVALPLAGYNVQEEGRITFDFIINTSGEVIYVKARSNTQPRLAEIGKRNIKNWKFDEVDPSKGRLKTSVTITFRLK